MSNIFTVSFSDPLDPKDKEELQILLQQIPEVGQVKGMSERGDPATALLIIQLIGGALSVVSSMLAAITGIAKIIKKKRLANAIITLPNGEEIKVDGCTVEDIARIVEAGYGESK